jgi:hypothetical protein
MKHDVVFLDPFKGRDRNMIPACVHPTVAKLVRSTHLEHAEGSDFVNIGGK